MFVIGGIILLVGTTLAFLAITFLNSSFGYQAANRAVGVANGGVYDAILLLMRNKGFSDTGYCVPATTIPCPAGYATVVVTQDSPSTGKVTVTSEATVSRYRRKVQAILSVSSSTGAVEFLSWQLLSL